MSCLHFQNIPPFCLHQWHPICVLKSEILPTIFGGPLNLYSPVIFLEQGTFLLSDRTGIVDACVINTFNAA